MRRGSLSSSTKHKGQVQSMHVLDHPSSSHSHVTTALKRTYSVDFELNIVFLLDSPGANKTKVWQQLPWPAI